MENETTKIQKLQEESQWSTWKFQVKITLIAAEVYEVVTGDDVKPVVAENADQTGLKAWKKTDAKAQRIIGTSVGNSQITHIKNCSNAKEMWDKLHSVFERKNETSLLLLHQKFFSFAKEHDENIVSYIARLEELVQRLSDLDEQISDGMVITKIIMSLPVEYSSFSSAWESVPKPQRTLDNLRARLMVEEDRLIARGAIETTEALIAKRASFSGEKKSGKKKNIPKRKTDKSKLKCFSCGKTGHWAKECNKKATSDKDEQAFACSAYHGTVTADNWILDSGASHHMTNRKDWFKDFQTRSCDIMIARGVMKGVGRGTIAIRYFNGESWSNGKLLDVVYVPELEKNLFSQNHALDQGLTIEATSKDCKLSSKDNNIVVVGVRRGPMTVMQIKVIPTLELGVSANVAFKQSTLKLWHERLAHQNSAHVKRFLKLNEIKFNDEEFVCEACMLGKHHRDSFKSREERSTKCGEIIHADVCGPMQETSVGGSRYFLLLKDDHSHYRSIYCMKQKSEVFEKLKMFIKLANNSNGHKISILRTDNGTEFTNSNVKKLLEQEGIRHQRTVPYTPEQNGSAEREMRTIVESARTMIHARDMALKFWAEAVNAAVFVINRTGTSTIANKTPYELWFGKKSKFDHLQPFGSTVFVHVPKERRRKLDPKAEKCIFVGYDENVKGFRVWNPATSKIQIVRDVKFVDECQDLAELQNSSDVRVKSESVLVDVDIAPKGEIVAADDDFQDAEEEADDAEADDAEVAEAAENLPGQSPRDIQRKSTGWCGVNNINVVEDRLRIKKNHVCKNHTCCLAEKEAKDDITAAFISIAEEPLSYEQAVSSDEKKRWMEAMGEEMESLKQNNTWKMVNAPKNQKVIDNKWVYKIKYKPDGTMERFKARLVVRGFTQEHGIDYQETFSPVVRFTSVRAILAIAAAEKMTLRQFDVKTAFLYGELEEDVYMKQPIGFNDDSGKVCKLIKSLYGLKQASRCWNKKFSAFIEKFRFIVCESDPCVFVRTANGSRLLLAIYVDDGLIAASNEKEIEPVINYLQMEFEIKSFSADCFLGLEISRQDDGSIHLRQEAYGRKVLRRFKMEDCNGVATPADSNQLPDDFRNSERANFPYREAVGSLMYLAIATRPDISFAVGVASRFLENPTETHVTAVKRILKYVKSTIDYGIKFDSHVSLDLDGFSDADYAGDKVTRRSTSGHVFLFGSGVISWCSERQKSVSLSTTESEYIAASGGVKELVWLQRLLREILGKDVGTDFNMDNQSAIRLIKNPEFHKRTKHIDVRYHFIREKFEEGFFNLHYVPSDEQLADIFTKALPKDRFQNLRDLLNIVSK